MALLEVDYLERGRDKLGKSFDIVIYLTDVLPGGAIDPTGVELCVLANNGDGGETIRDKCRDAVIALLHSSYGFAGLVHGDIIVDDETNS